MQDRIYVSINHQ